MFGKDEIARRANGSFFHATNENGLSEIYSRIDQMTPRAVETLSFRPRDSLSHVLLVLAGLIGVLAVLGFHVRSSRKAAA